MIKALLLCAAAGLGFIGSPWIGFAFGASLMQLSAIPDQQELMGRYSGQPKTDVVFAMLLKNALAVVGCLASAWFGYSLALLVKLWQ
jgi:hypothetical protein